MTHCLDRDEHCPETCFRVKLNDDYISRRIDFMHQPVPWDHLRGKRECPRSPMEVKRSKPVMCDPCVCDECSFISDGTFRCDKNGQISVSNWTPTEYYMMCGGKA
jgi:hypothetical protein